MYQFLNPKGVIVAIIYVSTYVEPGNNFLNYSLWVIGVAFVFAIICSVFAYFLYFKILESAGAGNLLICTIIIPPSSIFLNAFFLDQNITTNEYLGLIVIILGLIILDGRLFKKIIH